MHRNKFTWKRALEPNECSQGVQQETDLSSLKIDLVVTDARLGNYYYADGGWGEEWGGINTRSSINGNFRFETEGIFVKYWTATAAKPSTKMSINERNGVIGQ